MNINKDSWNIIQRIIRRYPDNKRLFAEYRREVLDTSDARDIRRAPTAYKAEAMETVYAERLAREIDAVEQAYQSLKTEEKQIVEARFWRDQNKNTPYEQIIDLGYSPRQMRRIAKRMVILTGKNLGEIR